MKRWTRLDDFDGFMEEHEQGEWVLYEDVKDDLEYLDKLLDVFQDMPVDFDEVLESYDER